MKTVLVICLILSFNNGYSMSQFLPFMKHRLPIPTGPRRSNSEISLKSFNQTLDHFDSNNTSIWSQRYYVSTEFFNKTSNNVVFMQLGGENAIDENWMLYGTWINSAKNYGALLFQIEHRFYGDSQPFPNLSTENLRYLSSEQALADVANFIKAMNEEYSLAPDVKWIVFGGSYSGSLAAWTRLKYPDLVYGSVASSSPLLAKLDFPEYYQVVIDDLAATSQTCVDALKIAMSQVEDILNDDNSNETVTNILNLCEPIEGLDSNDLNVQSFYNRLAMIFSSIAQLNGIQKLSIKDVCDVLTDESKGREINRLSEAIKLDTGSSCITNSYIRNIEYWKNIDIFAGSRQWIYQTCTEFGWFQPSNREDKVFGKGSSIDFLVNMCSDIFGPEFNRTSISNTIELVNANYGGTDINVTNVVFIQGSFDPWHPLGLTKTKNPEAPVIFIEGTSHCADMYPAGDNELPQLTEAKTKINKIIGEWLGFN